MKDQLYTAYEHAVTFADDNPIVAIIVITILIYVIFNMLKKAKFGSRDIFWLMVTIISVAVTHLYF